MIIILHEIPYYEYVVNSNELNSPKLFTRTTVKFSNFPNSAYQTFDFLIFVYKMNIIDVSTIFNI